MSKIICDVCGTSYPDTTTQCPICGCVRSADVEAVVTGDEAAEAVVGSTYTYVKGGRFSKANVKKRNSGKPVVTEAAKPAQVKAPSAKVSEPVKPSAPVKTSSGTAGQKSNLGLIIVIIVLLLAIIAVLSYIAVRFVFPSVLGDGSNSGFSEYVPSLDDDQSQATDPVDPDVACTAIVLSDAEVFFTAAGESYTLTATPEPANTTDEVLFSSEDDTIATVDADGTITAVATGETIVTVTCGTKTELCRVVCNFTDEGADQELVLDAETYTLTKKGETWTCYTGTIPAEEITWTSDDEKVATVSNGVVTAVAAGTTTIRAQYNETEVTCEIVCDASVNTTTEDTNNDTEENNTTEPTTPATGNLKFNTHDKNEMMLRVGESFSLRLCDENGKALTGVKYTSSNDAVCTVSEKGTVKCIAYGSTVYINAEYNGATYKCTVYVR